ncbi:MAG: ATP synthase F0 subunit B [Clostridia bacterium]|nr:ATP synthase F0 subunit B [Clostridia bacterium]
MFDHVNLWNIIWTIVNLLVLFLLLKKFLFGPVTKIMEERTKAITDSIQGAENKNRAAEAKGAEYDARLEAASAEAARIVAEARNRAQREYDVTLKAAGEDAQKVLADARAQIELDREKMLAGVRANMAELVLLTAAKISEKKMDADADRALVDSFLAEVGGAHE